MSIFKKRSAFIIYVKNKLKLIFLSIEINNNNSKFHSWPVTKNNKDNRVYKEKLIDFIPYNLLEEIQFKINQNEKLLSRINYEKNYLKKVFLLIY